MVNYHESIKARWLCFSRNSNGPIIVLLRKYAKYWEWIKHKVRLVGSTKVFISMCLSPSEALYSYFGLIHFLMLTWLQSLYFQVLCISRTKTVIRHVVEKEGPSHSSHALVSAVAWNYSHWVMITDFFTIWKMQRSEEDEVYTADDVRLSHASFILYWSQSALAFVVCI